MSSPASTLLIMFGWTAERAGPPLRKAVIRTGLGFGTLVGGRREGKGRNKDGGFLRGVPSFNEGIEEISHVAMRGGGGGGGGAELGQAEEKHRHVA